VRTLSVWLVVFFIVSAGFVPQAFGQVAATSIETATENAIQRYGIDHDRERLRAACMKGIAAEPGYPQPYFYLGVLDEADENWPAAKNHFEVYLTRDSNSDMATLARRELIKLPKLIKEDSTESGRLDRQYRQHLGYAGLLQKQGFAKEAFLETAQAAKLLPDRWEAYAIASSILLSQHDLTGANHFLELARKNVPAETANTLNGLAGQIKDMSQPSKTIHSGHP
jgi:hypothetical protein